MTNNKANDYCKLMIVSGPAIYDRITFPIYKVIMEGTDGKSQTI